jgi:serine/threonine protein phosphatase PrpC
MTASATPPEARDVPALACPTCGAEVAAGESYCEACGTSLALVQPAGLTDDPGDSEAVETSAASLESPITLSQPADRESAVELGVDPSGQVRPPCLACGGAVAGDGYCEVCGAKAPSERDHYVERPAVWVASCCDRGIRHHRNEDATAVAADQAPGSRAVLVVCDGVSTAPDSDVAALAAARAARTALLAAQPSGIGVPASQVGALAKALGAAARAANAAVVATAHAEAEEAGTPSCTFAAAILEADLAVFGTVGDSRAYWVPDAGGPESAVLLSVDDSVAQERIALGVPREEAENGPGAHAITRWLGRDAPDVQPRTGSWTMTGPGWFLVCSDGLWNYASEPARLQAVIAEQTAQICPPRSSSDAAATADPLMLAEALVRWANEQGGKDNIGVAVARHD